MEKVKAIPELIPSTSQKGVREFPHMVGYYREFINRFADVARPLTKLTRKDVKTEWSKDCQIGFDYLKADCLIKDPVFKYPDPNERYVISTDATDQAAAGILIPEYPYAEGKITKWPIAYPSAQFPIQVEHSCKRGLCYLLLYQEMESLFRRC